MKQQNNSSLSKIDKFNYLKSLVEGNAASAIDGFALTADNYESAVKLLKDRFADPQIIISSHMEELLNLPAVCDIHKVSKIRQLYDSIETHIRSLRNLGIDSSSYGSLLVPLILSKIPEEIRLIVARNIEKNEWNIDKLLCTFKLELEARERDVAHSQNLVLLSHLKIECAIRGNCPIRHRHCFLGKLLHLYHTVVIVRSNIHQHPVPL